MAVWKLGTSTDSRLALGPVDAGPQEYLPQGMGVDDLLSGGPAAFRDALQSGTGQPVQGNARTLAPIGTQEIWAAGVTYLRSRDARMEESNESSVYDKVYGAERPELFWKASASRVRGPGDSIGIRADSTWDVPEPELGLVVGSDGTILGYLVGNDVSSRSIEGANPLYLPQAKCFTGCCAVGPCIVPVDEAPAPDDMEISLEIRREDEATFTERVLVSEMIRSPGELTSWLFQAMDFPVGVVLLTGTALVPPTSFTLQPGDLVQIAIEGLGILDNIVERVGNAVPRQRSSEPEQAA